MGKQGWKIVVLAVVGFLLTACITDVWTGVSLAYDRHNLYKKLSDYQLAANASRALYKDQTFKQADVSIDLAVFNGDILLVGTVPTEALREEAQTRITALTGYRRFFNQLAITHHLTNDGLEDTWITAKIRSGIFADSDIDPHQFKVITSQQIVYLMGDVIPEEANKVIQMARDCEGVKRVVKLFKYYNLSDKASS